MIAGWDGAREVLEARYKYGKCYEVDGRRIYVVRGKPWHFQDEAGKWQEIDPQWHEVSGDFAWELVGCGYKAWIAGRLRDVPFLRVIDEAGRERLYRLGDPEWRTPAGVQVIRALPNLKLQRGGKKHELNAPQFLHDLAKLNLLADHHQIALEVDLPEEARRALPACTLERRGEEPRLVVPLVQMGLTAQQTYYGEAADGYIEGYSTIYTNARSTSTSCNETNTSARLGQYYDDSGYSVWRAYISFDTSGIPDDMTVASAKLYLCAALNVSDTDFNILVYRYTWAEALCSNREANYDGAYGGSAIYEGVFRNTADGWISGTYYNMAVASEGINLSGDTKYSVVSSRDVNSNQPTGREYVDFYTAEQSGTSQDPYLLIELEEGFALMF